MCNSSRGISCPGQTKQEIFPIDNVETSGPQVNGIHGAEEFAWDVI